MNNGYYHSPETPEDFEVIVLIENDNVTKYWINYGGVGEPDYWTKIEIFKPKVVKVQEFEPLTQISETKVEHILFLGLL